MNKPVVVSTTIALFLRFHDRSSCLGFPAQECRWAAWDGLASTLLRSPWPFGIQLGGFVDESCPMQTATGLLGSSHCIAIAYRACRANPGARSVTRQRLCWAEIPETSVGYGIITVTCSQAPVDTPRAGDVAEHQRRSLLFPWLIYLPLHTLYY